MKHLKNYKDYRIFENIQTDEEIHELCRKYRIENYTINEDNSIDVDGNVFLYKRYLTKLPLKFRNISGSFYCYDNNLTTLEGVPKSVNRDFYCFNNNLTTLKGAPRRVEGNFNCMYNKNLMSLEGISSTIHGDFNCYGTPVYYFWNNFLNEDKSLIDSFVEEWDVIHEDTVIIEVLEGWMEDNNINVEIDIEKIKSLGYKIE